MSKHNKHTKSHKKSKVKDRKRKSLAARRLNELKIKQEKSIGVAYWREFLVHTIEKRLIERNKIFDLKRMFA